MSNEFMARAVRAALENVESGRGGPFAAVIVRDGSVLASGTNLVTSMNDPTAHAEIVAIRAACAALNHFQLAGCDIYTTCEPCPMCLGAIYWARPARVFYGGTSGDAAAAGFDDSLIYREFSAPPSRRTIPMIQLMRDEALRAFAAWKAKADRVEY